MQLNHTEFLFIKDMTLFSKMISKFHKLLSQNYVKETSNTTNASFRLKSDMCAFLLQSVFIFFQEVGAENKFLPQDTVSASESKRYGSEMVASV